MPPAASIKPGTSAPEPSRATVERDLTAISADVIMVLAGGEEPGEELARLERADRLLKRVLEVAYQARRDHSASVA